MNNVLNWNGIENSDWNSLSINHLTLAMSNAIQTQTLKVLELTLSGLILLLHDKSLQQFPLQPVSW